MPQMHIKFNGSIGEASVKKRLCEFCVRIGKLRKICIPGDTHGYIIFEDEEDMMHILHKLQQATEFSHLKFVMQFRWDNAKSIEKVPDVIEDQVVTNLEYKYCLHGHKVTTVVHEGTSYVALKDLKCFQFYEAVPKLDDLQMRILNEKVFENYMKKAAYSFLINNKYVLENSGKF